MKDETIPGPGGPRRAVVIGAGIVGVATALRLRRDGHEVTIVDPRPPGEGASFGNGGVLASCSIVPVTTPGLLAKAPRMLLDPDQPLFLRWRYLPRLAPWLIRYLRHANAEDARRIAAALAPIVGDSLAEHRALSEGTPAAAYVVPSDYVFVYRDRAAFEGDAFGWGVRRDHGYRWDELEGAAFRAYEPLLAPSQGFGARLGDHGRISDPGAYVKALAAQAVAEGARLVEAEAEDVAREGGAVSGVRVRGRDGRGETLPCDVAVLAAGVWSGGLARRLGLSVPLESERGYHLELWEPSATPRAAFMIASGKFVVTPMEGRIRLAGVVEFGGLDAPPSRAPFALLRRQIRAAMPGLSWREEREWMGHRPAPADSIPVIGEVPGLRGAFCGFGHHHVGLTGGPRTARLLAQLISGRRPNVELAAYAPSRFQMA